MQILQVCSRFLLQKPHFSLFSSQTGLPSRAELLAFNLLLLTLAGALGCILSRENEVPFQSSTAREGGFLGSVAGCLRDFSPAVESEAV